MRQVQLNFNFGEKLWRVGTRDDDMALRKTEAALAACKEKDDKFQYRLINSGELREVREWSFEVRVSADSLSPEARLRSELKMLEEAVLANEIDFFVEDLSRVPLQIPAKLSLAAVLSRGDARDVLILKKGLNFERLKLGANIAAQGKRSEYMLRQLRPDLVVQSVRDTVYVGMERVLQGDYSGFIVPAADLCHVDLSRYVALLSFFPFTLDAMIPPPGQAMMGFFSASEHDENVDSLRQLADDPAARAAYLAETKLARVLLGIKVDVQRAAACHVYYQENKTARLLAANTLCEKKGLKAVKMQLSRKAESRILPQLEAAALKSLMGSISFVGSGLGTADHLTLRAKELLAKADCIIFDTPTAGTILSQGYIHAESIYMGGQEAEELSLPLRPDRVVRRILEEARRGRSVLRLCTGDPWLLGAAVAETQMIVAEGLAFELAPGLSSALAAPALAGVALTMPTLASQLHIIDGLDPLSVETAGPDGSYRQLAALPGTLVFLEPITRLPEICSGLLQAGMEAETPALLISEAGAAQQKILALPLDKMAAAAVRENIKPPAVLVIGAVAGETYRKPWWPASGVLSGRSVIVGKSRPHDPLAAEIKLGAQALGAAVLELEFVQHSSDEAMQKRLDQDFLQIMKNREKLRRPEKSEQWFVFTSGSAVEAFAGILKRLAFDVRKLAHIKIAAYGDSSLFALKEIGFHPDYVPPKADMEHLAAALAKRLSAQDQVVQIRGSISVPTLSMTLQMAQIPYVELLAYESRINQPAARSLLQMLDRLDFLVLTSPAAVYACADVLASVGLSYQKAQAAGLAILPALPAAASALLAGNAGWIPDELSGGHGALHLDAGAGADAESEASYGSQAVLARLADLAGDQLQG